jgi:hypothetical protein
MSYPALWGVEARDRSMAHILPPPPLPPVIEESRQLHNQSGLWRWLANDTCTTSQRLREQTKQIMAISKEVGQRHETLA